MADNWETVALGEVATVRSGYAFKSSDWTDSGIPVVKIANVKGGRLEMTGCSYVTPFVASEAGEFQLKQGDILVAMTGYIGDVARVRKSDLPCVLNQRVGKFSVRDDRQLDANYLFSFLSWSETRQTIEALGYGSAQPNVSPSLIHKVEIPLPPLAEQKAIAAVLGALDDKIELNRRMNATLEAMARALFQSWFVDFAPVRAKLDGRQPPGLDPASTALFPEHLENSTIGKKPVGWELAPLETALSVLEVGGRPKGGVGGITSGIPSIGAESIVGVGQFDFSKTKYVPVEFYEGMKKGHIQSHDVLLYKDGGRPGEYEPHVSMFGDGFPFARCSINEHVYRLRANERLSQEYLYFWLTSELAMAEMRVKGTGVAIPGLNSTAVRSLTVLVPSKPIVEAFTKQAAPIVTRILANSKQSRTLATLRDTLLPKLLRGELSAPKS